jgi:hypothetical protein
MARVHISESVIGQGPVQYFSARCVVLLLGSQVNLVESEKAYSRRFAEQLSIKFPVSLACISVFPVVIIPGIEEETQSWLSIIWQRMLLESRCIMDVFSKCPYWC